MKRSISMKSWKTTISLSALLFLMFALTVLGWTFIGVSMPSSSSSPASPAIGTIGYDKGANVITATGYSSGTPCTFWDLWNASNVNLWNVVYNNNNTSRDFEFDCKIRIGDGQNLTYFADNDKNIYFNFDSSAVIDIYRNASFTMGTLRNAATKSSSDGVNFLHPLNANSGWNIRSGANFTLYSCSIGGCGAYTLSLTLAGTGVTMWHCVLSKTQLTMSSLIGGDLFDISSANTWNPFYNPVAGPTLNNIKFFHGALATGHVVRGGWAFATSMTGLYVRDTAFTNTFEFNSLTVNPTLLNPDVEAWTFEWIGTCTGRVYRQYTFDLQVTYQNSTGIQNANVTISNNNALVGSWLTNSTGQIPTQILTMGYYNQTGGNAIYNYNPYNLTVTKDRYQIYTGNFTLSQKANWTIALQPLTDGELIEHVGFVPVDPGLTSPSGTYRWLDVADQAYSIGYRNSYNYSQATVEVAYCTEGNKLQGLLTARNLKPNFAYQLKLAGTPGTDDNERIGLAGRWWQEEWNGTTWANGQNLNDKGDGSSPNPNDQTYLSRRYIQDSSSPTGYHYRYTGYLVLDYFITDSNGSATLQFETGSCYHVSVENNSTKQLHKRRPRKNSNLRPRPLATSL